MWRVAEETSTGGGAPASLTYGAGDGQGSPATWDSHRIHHCVCDSRDGVQPADGPVGFVSSGVRTSNDDFVGGWTGYDCSRRRCPFGDDARTPGAPEVQTVRCSAAEDETFRVSFRGATSRRISGNATVAEVEAALENMTTIQDVARAARTLRPRRRRFRPLGLAAAPAGGGVDPSRLR